MSKIALFDADGVLLTEGNRASHRLAEIYNADPIAVSEFFENLFQECLVGNQDLKLVVADYLPRFGYPGTVDDFVTWWFDDDTEVRSEVLQMITEFKKQGYTCYLASNQEKHRAQYLSSRLGDSGLDGYFFSCDLGVKKPSAAFFQHILDNLDAKPEDVVYFDDDPKNVATARELGIQAELFTDSI